MNLNKLKSFTDSSGFVYGNEDSSIHIYSLIKMFKPKKIVDFGTGVGSFMLWSALACKENMQGSVYSIDNGTQWNKTKEFLAGYSNLNYPDFINQIISEHELNNFIEFKHEDINLETFNGLGDQIDFAIFDYNHSPLGIVNIIKYSLPRLSQYSTIIIDSVPSYLPSFYLIDKIVSNFNINIIPHSLRLDERSINFVLSSNFQLTNIIENKDRDQNSFSIINITPKDCLPQPNMHIRS